MTPKKELNQKRIYLIAVLLLATVALHAQKVMNESDVLQRVMQIHPEIQSALAEKEQYRALRSASFELPKTDVNVMVGQYNSIAKNDNNITIVQPLPFPTVWGHQRQLAEENITAADFKISSVKNNLILQVRQLIQALYYQKSLHQLLTTQDSLLAELVRAGAVRYKVGEGTLLEKTAIETQHAEVQNRLRENSVAIRNIQLQLQSYLQDVDAIDVEGQLTKITSLTIPDTAVWRTNPNYHWMKQQVNVAQASRRLERSRALPDLSIGYFNQTLIGYQTINNNEQYFGPSRRFQGFTVGIAVPLWFTGYQARVRAATQNQKAVAYQANAFRQTLQREVSSIVQQLSIHQNSVHYYEQSALPNATLLENQSIGAFRNGEIDYATLLLNLRQALTIRENYLLAVYQYNLSSLTYEHLKGNQ